MKMKRGKKLLSLLLAAVMTLGLMPTMASAAEIEAGGDNISAGDTVYYGAYPQSEYTPNTTPESPTEGETYTDTDTDGTQFVYVAKPANKQGNYYKIEPIAWRVLENSNGLFLIAEKNLDVKQYNTSPTTVTWETSTVRSWLNGYDSGSNDVGKDDSSDNFIDTAFGTAEQEAISSTSVINDANPTYNTSGGINTNDQIFFLSIQEATSYFTKDAERVAVNTGYTASYSMNSAGTADRWWLRSPGSYSLTAALVKYDGSFDDFGDVVSSPITAVRPAFNVNLASVIFTSAAAGGKSVTVGSLEATQPTDAIKLTVLNSEQKLDVYGLADGSGTNTLKFSYNASTVTTGTNQYISCVLVNSSGEVKYYGKLENTGSGGSGTVEVPLSDVDFDTYTLKIFSEQANSNNHTDFASKPFEIEIKVDSSHNGTPTDADKPTVLSVTPSGSIVAATANTLSVTFSVEMNTDPSIIGTVTLDNGASVFNGVWQNDKKTINYSLSSLMDSKTYDVSIAGFKDIAGNEMVADLDHSFTTLAKEATPTVTINYIAETLTGLNGTYSFQGGRDEVLTGTRSIESSWFGNTVSIVKKGDGTYTTDSVAQSLPIDARPGTPSVSYKNETVQGDNDGTITITNYNSSFIYEISNDGTSWSDAVVASGIIKNLAADTYYVRVKAAANTNFKSNSATVVIAQGDTPTYTLNVEDVIFVAITEGDDQPDAKEIMITSSGNSTATISSVTVSGTAFSIDDTNATPTVTSGGENITYKIQPDASLTAGDYEETITVTYNDGYKATAKVRITVIALVDAGTPSITVQPQDASVKKGNTATLSVTANVSDGGELSYQWYSCDADGKNPIAISGADESSYSPSTATTGTYYYNVVVTNINAGVTGSQTASVTSNVVAVTVTRNTRGSSSSSSSTSYTLTFETNGGSTISSVAKSSGTSVDLSGYTTTREGYTFTGWYSDKALTEKVTSVTLAKNTTVYAGWELKENDEKQSTTHEPYISGYSDGTFRPDSSITRAETAQLLYNISSAKGSGANKFSDVSSDKWYYNAVTNLTDSGVISGYTDGTFKPVNSITRAEFVALVVRYAGKTEATGGSFSDVSSDHWAAGYIAAATQAGYISGYTDSSFRPDKSITRAEAVTVLNAMLGRKIDKDALSSLTMPFSDVSTSHWAYNQILEASVQHAHSEK